ncbi:MAG: MBL fold metallo-hydrolase [Acidobacteria bacterium]|nr:MBL fold metallo-hydrolase [Acidobacteriota bacterium]
MKILRIRSWLAAFTVTGALAVSVWAQGQQDFDTVEIKSTRIIDNFYTLEGRGGTIGVLAGPDGILLVDSQFAPLTDKIVAAIRRISNSPIRFLVNTHLHGDHIGGNENFGKMGVTIFAREELRYRLAYPAPGPNDAPGVPATEAALPAVTFSGRVSWHMNGQDVELIPVPRAHTDGDTMVYFPGLDVLMTGDFYRSIQFPYIDRNNGGTLDGMLDGLGAVIGMAGPNTKIIPGHGPIVDRDAVRESRDMILVLRDRVAGLIQQGKSVEEVIAVNPANDYEAKISNTGTTRDRFLGQLYEELKAAR